MAVCTREKRGGGRRWGDRSKGEKVMVEREGGGGGEL